MTSSRFQDAPQNTWKDENACMDTSRSYHQQPFRSEFDLYHSNYVKVRELIPKVAPQPLGTYVITTRYTDKYLYHYTLTGIVVTGITKQQHLALSFLQQGLQWI
jgi:hypothetical protein